MDEARKKNLIKAAEVLTVNARYFVDRADAAFIRLRKAGTAKEAADAGERLFFWLEQIGKEMKTADAAFMRELGRMWEFD